MKTITVTLSDEAARNLADAANASKRSEEDVAKQALEGAFRDDWFDELDEEDRAAVLQGVAEADRGEFATDDEVAEAFSRFKR